MEYSAVLTSQSFWFLEFKKTVKLKQEGMDYAEIKRKCVEENLFGAAKEYRALRMAGYMVTRIKAMDEMMIELFWRADVATQKLINLFTILKTDRLFLEFVYEVYREKVMFGVEYIEDADVNIFFTQKETQSASIAEWRNSTKRHLRSCYLNFMTDANLLTVVDKKKIITPPILDSTLEKYLLSLGEDTIVKAMTGER